MSQTHEKENFRQALKVFFEKGGNQDKGVPLEYFKDDLSADKIPAVGDSHSRTPHKHKEKHHRSHGVYKDTVLSKPASIILISTEDDATSGKIYFDIGQAHGKKFNISQDGGSIEFKVSGVYVVKFESSIFIETDSAVLEFVKTPEFDSLHKPFSKFNISSGEVIRSTLLKFKQGDRLEVNVRSSNESAVAVGSGTVMMLYKVEDC